ncbi:MAG: hypothetical protein ED558_16960 [Oricola sp.]|nr:MAG: hypothetical protein ED558_16960 [Oricola sp.]
MTIGIETVHAYLTSELDGVRPVEAWGETSYFFNPGGALARGTYLATIKQKDGPNDRASDLDRDGVWRLNIGVGKRRFQAMFGALPTRPPKGETVKGSWDFAAIDRIVPHPVYGWMGWVAVLCPSEPTFKACKPLIAEAHDRAAASFRRRVKPGR